MVGFKVRKTLVIFLVLLMLILSTGSICFAADNLNLEKGYSLTKENVNEFVGLLKANDAAAIRTFNSLSINKPEVVQKVITEVTLSKDHPKHIVNFEDGSSIVIEYGSIIDKNFLNPNDFGISSNYQATITDYGIYRHYVWGIEVARYSVWTEYGTNSYPSGPCYIIDHWDEGSAVWPCSVTPRGTRVLADATEPVEIRGNGTISALGSSFSVTVKFYGYADWNKNYCTCIIN